MNFSIQPYKGINDDLTFASDRPSIHQKIGSLLTFSRNDKYITDFYDPIELIITFSSTSMKPLEFIILKPSSVTFGGVDFLSLSFNHAEKKIKSLDVSAKYYEPRTFYTKKFGFGIYAEDERNWKNKLVTSVCVFAEGKI